jgi:hypothetical protein
MLPRPGSTGDVVVFQTRPLAETEEPPSEVTFPPEVAEFVKIEPTALVVRLAREGLTLTKTSAEVIVFEHGAPKTDLQTM